MPLIEELPTTQPIKASHGWAYVPDTGPIAAQQPGTRDRKRLAAGRTAITTAAAAANASAKQQKAIQARLDSLNKENYRDGVTVPLPQRTGAGATSSREKAGRKMTSNVRRILTYQRGFAHYLADEEANNPGGVTVLLPAGPGLGPGPAPVAAVGAGNTKEKEKAAQDVSVNAGTGKRRSTVGRSLGLGLAGEISSGTATPDTTGSTPQKRGRKRGRPSNSAKAEMERGKEIQMEMEMEVEETSTNTNANTPAHVKVEEQEQEQEQDPKGDESKDRDTLMTDVSGTTQPQASIHNSASDPTHASPSPVPPAESSVPSVPPYPPEWDTDPLLASTVSDVPRMPSERIMQQLISELPLTYNAARAKPLAPDKQLPPRHFCGMCGYWGKVKCGKCAEWTCGLLACWKGHEGVCPLANAF